MAMTEPFQKSIPMGIPSIELKDVQLPAVFGHQGKQKLSVTTSETSGDSSSSSNDSSSDSSSNSTSKSCDEMADCSTESSTESNVFESFQYSEENANDEFSELLTATNFVADEKIYPNSRFTVVETLSMLFSWFASFPGISKEALSRLLFLLHSFILPEGNILPESYGQAHLRLKQHLTDMEVYDCCPNDCLLFRNQYATFDHCPKCRNDRFIPNTKQAYKKFKYLPLLPRLRRMFSCSKVSEMIQEHNLSDASVAKDIHDSTAWKHLYSATGPFKGDARYLSFAICADGMNPFSKEKTTYSMWPITLSLLNFPPTIRTKFSSLFLIGIIPGKKEPKDLNPYLQLLTDELLDLPNHPLYDAFKGEWFTPHATVLLNILDYPGQNKIFKTTGTFAYYVFLLCVV